MSDYTSTAATALPVTLDDVKAHMNVSHASDDGLIDSYIRAATTLLEARTNRCFVTQTRKCVMNNFDDSRYVHGRKIYLPRSPVKSVSSVTYVNSSAGTTSTLPSSDYVVSTGDKPGWIAESYNATWPSVQVQPNNVTVTYVAGHSTVTSGVPYNVKVAVQQLVAHWYRNREHINIGNITSELGWMIDSLLESEHVETYG